MQAGAERSALAGSKQANKQAAEVASISIRRSSVSSSSGSSKKCSTAAHARLRTLARKTLVSRRRRRTRGHKRIPRERKNGRVTGANIRAHTHIHTHIRARAPKVNASTNHTRKKNFGASADWRDRWLKEKDEPAGERDRQLKKHLKGGFTKKMWKLKSTRNTQTQQALFPLRRCVCVGV